MDDIINEIADMMEDETPQMVTGMSSFFDIVFKYQNIKWESAHEQIVKTLSSIKDFMNKFGYTEDEMKSVLSYKLMSLAANYVDRVGVEGLQKFNYWGDLRKSIEVVNKALEAQGVDISDVGSDIYDRAIQYKIPRSVRVTPEVDEIS